MIVAFHQQYQQQLCWELPTITVIYNSTLIKQLNSLTPGRCGCNLKSVMFKLISRIDILSISCEIAPRWMPQDLIWWLVNIGSGNGLVPSGNKPLPEPMLTKIFVVTRSQWVNEPTWHRYGGRHDKNMADIWNMPVSLRTCYGLKKKIKIKKNDGCHFADNL